RFCPELCPKEDKFQLKELASKLDGHGDKWINVATVDCEINVVLCGERFNITEARSLLFIRGRMYDFTENVTETNSDFLRNFTKRLKNVTLEDGGRGEGLRIPRGPMWFTPLIKPITDKLDLFFEMVDYRMLSTGMGAFSVLLVNPRLAQTVPQCSPTPPPNQALPCSQVSVGANVAVGAAETVGAAMFDAPGGSAQRGRGPGRGPPPVGGYDDAAGRDMPYGGGTPIDADSVGGAPRTAVRGSRIVGFGGGGEYDDPAADALGGLRGPGHGPPPVGGYDDAAGQGRVYGGGTRIEDPSAAPGYGGGTPMDDSAGAPRTAVRGSRIVGFGGGGEYDDPAAGDPMAGDRGDAGPSVRGSRIVGYGGGGDYDDPAVGDPGAAGLSDAPGGSAQRGRGPGRGPPPVGGYDDAAGRDMPYGGGTPIDADSVGGAPRTAVRGSRIVGFGGGGEYDDPAAGDPMAGDRGDAGPSVRGSRIVGYGGGGDYDDPAVGDPGAAGLSDAPGGSAQRGRGPGRGPPPVGGYDDAAGRDMPYGGGTPIDADSVGGAPRTAVRGSRIVGFGGGGEYDDPAAGDPMAGDRGDAGPS
ncbi:hypothetical protein AURANDRAFT_68792, partial [Aureococcus anophagefferens]